MLESINIQDFFCLIPELTENIAGTNFDDFNSILLYNYQIKFNP